MPRRKNPRNATGTLPGQIALFTPAKTGKEPLAVNAGLAADAGLAAKAGSRMMPVASMVMPVAGMMPVSMMPVVSADQISSMKTLLMSNYDMSLYERRVLLKILEKLPAHMPEQGFVEIELTIEEIIRSAHLKGGSVYTELQKATEDLIRHVCRLKQTDGFLQVGLLSSAKYIKGESRVLVRFDPVMYGYFAGVRSDFTPEHLGELMSFQSYYSQCFYELFLRQAADRDYLYVPLTQLRELLRVEDKYERYADFRKRILEQAQADLAAYGNAAFIFKPQKQPGSGKVTGIHFYLRRLLTAQERPST